MSSGGGGNIFDWSVKFTSQIFSGWGKYTGLIGQTYKQASIRINSIAELGLPVRLPILFYESQDFLKNLSAFFS